MSLHSPYQPRPGCSEAVAECPSRGVCSLCHGRGIPATKISRKGTSLFKKILLAVAAPLVALGVQWGATTAHAAPLPFISTSTHFSYTVGSAVVRTSPGSITPPSHMAVQLDLTQAVVAAGVADLATAQADAVADAALLVSGSVISSSNVSHVPGADVFLNLFAVNSNAFSRTFELSATSHGTGIAVPPFTVSGVAGTTGSASVSWLRLVLPPPVLAPFVFNGHVITEDNNTASVGWSDGLANSAAAWQMGTVNGHVNHCVQVQEFGFGFSDDGSPHIGFTCDNGDPAKNVGFLRGLAPGHTYALRIQPAAGTYGDNHPIPGTNARAHVTVVTTS